MGVLARASRDHGGGGGGAAAGGRDVFRRRQRAWPARQQTNSERLLNGEALRQPYGALWKTS